MPQGQRLGAQGFGFRVSGLELCVSRLALTRRLTLSIKKAQKPYIIGSLGPEALKYGSFEGKGYGLCKAVLRQVFSPLGLKTPICDPRG